ncbi:MAG: flagellar hook-associated protein 2 [bacterium]|jgi:flagellar hook-associated protein 2|nr:flagellar hook-associated protein 2 [Solirubrobacteraceae bacterium]
MAGLTLSGMASGLDSATIVEQLMQIERQSQVKLKVREAGLQARQSALTDVNTRLKNLATAAKALTDVGAWADTQSLDVNDATKVGARRLGGAAPGGHELVVTTLARAEQRGYAYSASDSTLSFTTSAGTTSVSLTAADTGQTAADKINATAGVPVYAVFVKDPGNDPAKDRLILTRKDTGQYAAADLAVGGTTTWAASEARTAGVDAAYTIDGVAGSNRTNVLTAAVPGLELTLKATGTSSITVGAPGPDPEAVKGKVKAFVDQYNSTIDFIRGKLTEKRVPNAATETDARKGVLFADTQLTGLLSALRTSVSERVKSFSDAGSPIAGLGDIGVSTGAATGTQSTADQLAGKLTVDDAKLTAALQNNRLDVKAFLTDATNGISTKLTSLLDPVSKSDGVVDQRAKQAGSEITRIDKQLETMESRLTAKSDRLKAQFAAMEAAMARSQTQQQWLTAQLAGLS